MCVFHHERRQAHARAFGEVGWMKGKNMQHFLLGNRGRQKLLLSSLGDAVEGALCGLTWDGHMHDYLGSDVWYTWMQLSGKSYRYVALNFLDFLCDLL